MIGIGMNLAYQPGYPVRRSGASLEYDFTKGTLTPIAGAAMVAFSRSSPAWYFNSAGVLTQAGADEPRIDYDPATLACRGLLIEEARVNYIRNNTMVGGGPGALPNNWATSVSAGMSRTIVGTGVDANGIPYIDIRFNGTPGDLGYNVVAFDTLNAIPITASQSVAVSAYIALVGGSLANLTSVAVADTIQNSSSGIIQSSAWSTTPVTSAFTRISYVRTITSDPAAAYIRPLFRWNYLNTTTAVDFTVRIGLPQCEFGTFVTSPILTSSAAGIRVADGASINNLPAWYLMNDGAFSLEYAPAQNVVANTGLLHVYNNVFGRGQALVQEVDGIRARTRDGTVDTVAKVLATITPGSVYKIAASLGSASRSIAANGSAAVSDATLTNAPTDVSTLLVGRQSIGGTTSYVNGWVRSLKYFPRPLVNAELQSYTQ